MANTISFNASDPDITQSDVLYARALGLIPSQTQTLAKGAGQYVRGVAPKFVDRAKGAHLWDVDGNEFIDYNMGIGPISLGYAYSRVDEAIRAQLERGITFSLVHPLEVEVAELIREVVPNAEMVRYSKSGNDVTSAAVRLARAFTGRDTVLCCGYHGWHDWYIATTDRNRGIPRAVQDLSYTINYNDLESVIDALDDDTACVILEPVVFDEPKNRFLHELKAVCERNGTLLIFDEMWTGFRLALGGAQEYFDVKADLACFSKAVANGMPLSVLTGRADVMSLLEQDVFFYTTFGGEALSLAAAKATIEEMRAQPVHEHLFRLGARLRDGFNAIAAQVSMPYAHCKGYACRSIVTFDASAGNPLFLKSFMQQELVRRGILWAGFHNMSYSHSDADVEHTLAAYGEVLPLLKAAVEANAVASLLRGEPVEAVFRRVGNFHTKARHTAA
ncbi:MAG: aminotransferase class III-fold pyridoxal phosphate-dependent enzyme [Bacteroidetes bacterium]|nr:aminotransferase class III-fold pyridoxal phosphate-dependent enzyme [Bacteroidota bacterium]